MHYCRNDFELTNVPPRIIRIAEDRVRPILEALPALHWDIRKLVVSAYVQGFCDCEAGINRDK
jgi:hypothetical protein